MFRHPCFPGKLLHCVKKYAKVSRQGPPEHFFDAPLNNEEAGDAGGAVGEPHLPARQPLPEVFLGNFQMDDPEIVRAVTEGIVGIDDDNQPARENIPHYNTTRDDTCQYSDVWGHDGLCFRRMSSANNRKAKLIHHSSDLKLTKLQLFEILFPTKWVKEVLIPETNKELRQKLVYGEFLQFLGIILKISTQVGFDRFSFWQSENKDDCKRIPPFTFNKYMSRGRFSSILAALKFTSMEPPGFVDRFWEIREMLEAWNKNMENEFLASWVCCLDESMSKWLNQYTAPGFMVVPRKPWKCGNEYHTICCSITGILFALELIEGKDRPILGPNKEHEEKGKTVGLCLRLTKSLQGTGTIVVMDSGFCVVKAIVEMRKVGIFSHALIKKRKYWPRFIKGQEIKDYFQDKDPGYYDCKKMTYDDVDFHVVGLKEPDYMLMLMTTYGGTNRFGKDQRRSVLGKAFTFKYPEVPYMHYAHRDSVDNHNSRRMFPIAIEEQMKTARWPFRVFQFILAVTEVNGNLANSKILRNEMEEQINYRYALAEEMLNNPYMVEESVRTRSQDATPELERHRKLMIAKNMTFKGNELVPCKTSYIQLKCKDCGKKRQRWYCSCSPGHIRCDECFNLHKFNL